MVVSGAGDVFYLVRGAALGIKSTYTLFRAGYGVKLGSFEGLYVMPKIKGFVVGNYKFKNGKRFSVQYGHWKGIGNTPLHERFYFKLPGKTNQHWSWGRP